MQFALSQIFMVSCENDELEFNGSPATTNYGDILGANAFKNRRDLLELGTLNPMVGIFLSFVRNDREDPATGRMPDENFARAIMQPFSIGTILLNPDGTRKSMPEAAPSRPTATTATLRAWRRSSPA